MYCYHCGKFIDEEKIEGKSSSFSIAENAKSSDELAINYVCPRCGCLIHKHHSEEDNKSLARAAHAQIQRGNNSFASGMGSICIAVILFAISLIFFFLSQKAATGFIIDVHCAEFYVCIVFGLISVILLIIGLKGSISGKATKNRYEALLKDLNNNTFVQ